MHAIGRKGREIVVVNGDDTRRISVHRVQHNGQVVFQGIQHVGAGGVAAGLCRNGMKTAERRSMNVQSLNDVLRMRSWHSRFELPSLILIALMAGGLWLFLELADAVLEGGTRGFDRAVLLMMRTPGDLADPLGPGWMEELGRDLTALGGVGVLTLITLIVTGFLLLQGKSHAALLLLAAVGSGMLFSTLLKLGFDRPRPELVSHGSIVYTASFPSGHSMMSAVAYLTLGGLLARVQPHRRLKSFLLFTAALLTALVGVSRVYLGVHWPTDVLAGWTAGAVWASFCWLIASWLQGRGDVESDVESPEDLE
jgi:undecaprenyl-diphosphatase